MFLQVYFFITSIYGWLNWKSQHQKDKPISILSNKKRILLFSILIILTLPLGYLVKNIHLLLPKIFIHPAAFPFIDTFIAISSIIGTILLAKRILENWLLWIIVDIICVYVYAKKNILFISIEYGVFVVLASYGLFLWLKSIKNVNRLSIG